METSLPELLKRYGAFEEVQRIFHEKKYSFDEFECKKIFRENGNPIKICRGKKEGYYLEVTAENDLVDHSLAEHSVLWVNQFIFDLQNGKYDKME